MELKPYQLEVIEDLRIFLDCVQDKKNIPQAFNYHWENHRHSPIHPFPGYPVEPYKDNIRRVPHVCVKVPTAGGKTFIAINALNTIFHAFDFQKPQVVAWLVPSVTILDQTLKNLKNTAHPYRQKLDVLFNGRVEIYDKDRLMQASGFNPVSVKEQLSIFVLSYDSFKSSNKEGRKSYQENSNLEPFVPTFNRQHTLLPEVPESALIQVINQLNPVVVVDESHNAETELSVEMLRNFNPSFILDLTATPRKNSNIISFVDSMQLKKENMVKLPVIVYNHHDTNDVISSAIILRQNLENIAREEEKNGGSYIRPIVLFQAQPKTSDDTVTFSKIKQWLVSSGIPENQIAIKTADVNEIKKYDNVVEFPRGLMDKNCPVRYIITVNALKEGWDCPFAYILASLANKSSVVDVEQVLGRILRQPEVRQHNNALLNMSYVFTASSVFLDTLENIVKALNKAGFSRRDFRVSNTFANDANKSTPAIEQLTLLPVDQTQDTDLDQMIDISKIQEATATASSQLINNIQNIAIETNNQYDRIIEEEIKETDIPIPTELKEKMSAYKIKDLFKADAESIKLPEFYLDIPVSLTLDMGQGKTKVEQKILLKDFRLTSQDINITFDSGSSELYKVDIAETVANEAIPEYLKLDDNIKDDFIKYISGLPEEKQLEQLSGVILKQLSKFDTISQRDLKEYVARVIANLNAEQRGELKYNPYRYAQRIEQKIKSLCQEYAESQFQKLLDTDKITIAPAFKFAKTIYPTRAISSITKALYEQEDEPNNFERKVINDIANLPNIKYWHKNIERKGFCINGFLNHYPDFIIVTKKDKIIVLETKGDYLDNSDSKAKLRLGQIWANKAGSNYKYFMVFDANPIPNAHSAAEIMEVLKEL